MTPKLDHICTVFERGEHIDRSQIRYLLDVACQANGVRIAQKRYFKEKGFANLDASRKEERTLDRLLAENYLLLLEGIER